MRRHAPQAESVGVALLPNYRFIITADGYASIEPKRNAKVYGVLWHVSMRDRATLNVWENIAGGLYRAVYLPVQRGGRRQLALTYPARPRGIGRPKTGYMELVIAAALERQLPQAYIASLRHWLPRQISGAHPAKLGDFGWT